MKLQKTVWTSEPGGESWLLNTLVLEVEGHNRSWLHRAKAANHHAQCSPRFWPICLFTGWLWFVFFFLPLCCVCTYVCTRAHTHTYVYSSQRRVLVCSPVAPSFISYGQSLSLSPELTIVCLGWRANPSNPPLSPLPTGTYNWLFAWVLGPELKPLCLSSKHLPTETSLQPPGLYLWW